MSQYTYQPLHVETNWRVLAEDSDVLVLLERCYIKLRIVQSYDRSLPRGMLVGHKFILISIKI